MTSYKVRKRRVSEGADAFVHGVRDDMQWVGRRARIMQRLKTIPAEERHYPDHRVKQTASWARWMEHARIAERIRNELRESMSPEVLYELHHGNKIPEEEIMKQALRELEKLKKKIPDAQKSIDKWPELMAQRAKKEDSALFLSPIEQAVNLLYLAKCRRYLGPEYKDIVWDNLPF